MGRDRREVGHEIHVLSNMIGRKIDEEKRQRNMGDVSPVQAWVIRYLHDHKGQEICQRDLERDFNITRSTVTGILQLMEKKGYILRVSVPTDARLKQILLTNQGEDLYYEFRDHIQTMGKTAGAGNDRRRDRPVNLPSGKNKKKSDDITDKKRTVSSVSSGRAVLFLQETIQLKPRKPFPMISLLLVIIMKAPGSFFFRKFRSWTAWLRFMTVRMMNFC